LIHPITLSLFLGTIIIVSLPPVFQKYMIHQTNYQSINHTTTNFWFDFDGDRLSEEVNFYNTPDQPNVIIRKDRKIIAQWDMQGEFPHSQFFFTADYDRNGKAELYVTAISRDSLFIYGIDPFKNPGSFFLKKTFDSYHISNIGLDCCIYFVKATDLNGDGFREVVFSVSTGYSAYPRKIYALDIRNQSIHSTPESCSTKMNPLAYDLNEDGVDEIIVGSSAFGNCDTVRPFNDHKAWLMVYDRNLQYLFPPVGFGKYMSTVNCRPVLYGGHTCLVVLQVHCGTEPVGNYLMLYDINGNLLKRKEMGDYPALESAYLTNTSATDRNHVYLIHKTGLIERIDTELNVLGEIKMEGDITPLHERLDIDRDRQDEFIFFSFDARRIIITRHDFQQPAGINISRTSRGADHRFSVFESPDQPPHLYFQSGENCYLFKYSGNPLYILKYPLFACIYLVLGGLIYLIYHTQKIRAKRKYETEKRIAELQLRSIKGQTDPHFTLNLLNSMGALFDAQDKRKAGYIFGKYSKMLRTTILSSEGIDSTLKTELEFVENYLDLEKFRFGDKFEYQIEVDKDVDTQIAIPRMLIHTFVENAVKHGIRHRDAGGMISLSITNQDHHCLVHIRDNGPGPSHDPVGPLDSTGKGLKIVDDILRLYYELRKVNISYLLEFHDGQQDSFTGASVHIKIPVTET